MTERKIKSVSILLSLLWFSHLHAQIIETHYIDVEIVNSNDWNFLNKIQAQAESLVHEGKMKAFYNLRYEEDMSKEALSSIEKTKTLATKSFRIEMETDHALSQISVVGFSRNHNYTIESYGNTLLVTQPLYTIQLDDLKQYFPKDTVKKMNQLIKNYITEYISDGNPTPSISLYFDAFPLIKNRFEEKLHGVVVTTPDIKCYSLPFKNMEIETLRDREKLVVHPDGNSPVNDISTLIGLLFSIELVDVVNGDSKIKVKSDLNWKVQNEFTGLVYKYKDKESYMWFDKAGLLKKMESEPFKSLLDFFWYNELYDKMNLNKPTTIR
jgi:hypothetical protein